MTKETMIEYIGVETEENEIEVDGVVYIEKTTYRKFNDGSKKIACSTRCPKKESKPLRSEPTQLDRIEALLNRILEKMVTE